MLREALSDLKLRGTGRTLALTGERTRAASRLREAAHSTPDDILRSHASSAAGLSAQGAAERLEEHGENQVAHERPPAWYVHLWHGFANAFSALLATLAIVSWLTEDIRSALVIESSSRSTATSFAMRTKGCSSTPTTIRTIKPG